MGCHARSDAGPEDARAGFSLVEIIAVLVLVGVLTAAAGLAAVPMAQGFLQAIRNTEVAGKVQLAMARMDRDFTVTSEVGTGTGSSMTFRSRDSAGTLVWQTLSWSGVSGDPLTLDGITLLDDVSSFQLSYVYLDGGGSEVVESSWTVNSRAIDVALQVVGVGATYALRVYPRNL